MQALGLQLAAGQAGKVHLQTADQSCIELCKRTLPLSQLLRPLKQAGQGRLQRPSHVVNPVCHKLSLVQQALPAY